MHLCSAKEFFIRVWVYVLKYSSASTYFHKVFGAVLHEKLIISPQLEYWPNIRNPNSFNEKIAHRKIFTDREIFTTVSDKWAVRDYVRKRIGEEYLNQVYSVTKFPNQIPFDDLPEEYVIKSNHGSAWNIIVDDDSNYHREDIRKECERWLSKTYGTESKEYWYERIEPKILVEKRLYGKDGGLPRDYKFFVFHGHIRYIQVDFDRNSGHTRRFFDNEWNPQEFTKGRPLRPLGPIIDKPDRFEEMKTVAQTLGEGLKFARVDLYDTAHNGIIFGEITLAPGAARSKFEPKKYDYIFGSYWMI